MTGELSNVSGYGKIKMNGSWPGSSKMSVSWQTKKGWGNVLDNNRLKDTVTKYNKWLWTGSCMRGEKFP